MARIVFFTFLLFSFAYAQRVDSYLYYDAEMLEEVGFTRITDYHYVLLKYFPENLVTVNPRVEVILYEYTGQRGTIEGLTYWQETYQYEAFQVPLDKEPQLIDWFISPLRAYNKYQRSQETVVTYRPVLKSKHFVQQYEVYRHYEKALKARNLW